MWLSVKDFSEDWHLTVNVTHNKGWKKSNKEILTVTLGDYEILQVKKVELQSWKDYYE